MLPLNHDPHFTIRFADDRIISRFHLEGVQAGRRVAVFKIDADSGEPLGLLATESVAKAAGWTFRSRLPCGSGKRSLWCRNQ